MKTIVILFSLILFAACSSEEDPKPKFDCESLQREVTLAKTAMDSIFKTRPWDNAVQSAKDKWEKDYSEARQSYVDAQKTFSASCK